MLIVSQFLDFKAIEIGQPGYADVNEITRAPREEAQTPMDHHSLVLVLTGVIAVLTAVAAALTRKRVTGLVLVLGGCCRPRGSRSPKIRRRPSTRLTPNSPSPGSME